MKKLRESKIAIKIVIWVNNLFKDYWAYNVASMPYLNNGEKSIGIDVIVRFFKEHHIWLYDETKGTAPILFKKALFSFRKPKILEISKLSKEQIDKIIDKI